MLCAEPGAPEMSGAVGAPSSVWRWFRELCGDLQLRTGGKRLLQFCVRHMMASSFEKSQ